jgi:hypothetical protein
VGGRSDADASLALYQPPKTSKVAQRALSAKAATGAVTRPARDVSRDIAKLSEVVVSSDADASGETTPMTRQSLAPGGAAPTHVRPTAGSENPYGDWQSLTGRRTTRGYAVRDSKSNKPVRAHYPKRLPL